MLVFDIWALPNFCHYKKTAMMTPVANFGMHILMI